MGRARVSTRQAYDNFGESFRRAYEKATPFQKTARVTDSVMAEAPSAVELGHPEYVDLKAGQMRSANAVVGFVDIRGITKLSFALDSEELLRVIQALTEASIRAIHDGGGYIGEFTGDGVMSYFGDSTLSDEEATLAALETMSVLFKSVEDIVNPKLKVDGLDPIRISAGMEFGEILWTRIGVGSVSQLKPIGTATFLAGKLSQGGYTNSWECKVGGELANWIPDEFRQKAKQYGPVVVNGQQFTRDLYLFNWRQYAADSIANQAETESKVRKRFLGSGKLSAVMAATNIVSPAPTTRSGPRPLKDQPFF